MFDRQKYMQRARVALKEKASSRDLALSQTVATVTELDRCINTLYEKLTEWYGLYFPELKMQDIKAYCNVVLYFDRKSPDAGTLSQAIGQKYADLAVARARASTGADLSETDLEGVRSLAGSILSLYSLREQIETYQAGLAQELAPNVCILAEPALTAKLVAQARSLRELALMPASTIQVMGASKALFKHLKSGSKPPKHGVIFQHASISMAPKKLRGRVARALAAKIAIAARADAFTRNPIAGKLKADFEKRVKEIRGGI